MTHRIGPEPVHRPALLALLVTLALLAGAAQAGSAPAEVVENPAPDLIARWEPCEPRTGVTVVVDRNDRLGDGKVYVGCAPGPQPDGWVALREAGFAVEGVGGGEGFVCRIDGQPTPAEESCAITPGTSRYWSYWHGKPGGRWGYSGIGAANPLSAAGVDAVQGWSFGGGDSPRIEPMNGDGPSGFVLSPAQASSTVAAALARDWLVAALAETAAGAKAGELSPNREALETLLTGAIALRSAGSDPALLSRLSEWLENGRLVEYADPAAGAFKTFPERLALGILGVRALGHDPSTFAGLDLPAALSGLIDEATGKVTRQSTLKDGIAFIAPTVEALAGEGALPAKALKTVDLILTRQDATTGGFARTTAEHVSAMRALVATRDAMGADGLGQPRFDAIEAALPQAGAFLEGIQAPDGGMRAREDPDPVYDPGVESTAVGAVGLALAGLPEAAERAAKWVSRYQVTAEYAGTPDPDGGDEPPAYASIGAFLDGEDALRNAIAHGVADSSNGVQAEAQSPTVRALLALVTAGPYGPYHASFDRQALLFSGVEVGARSVPQAATLTNRDVRPVTVAAAALAGPQAADFGLDATGCAGRTLTPGESCELAASFEPTAMGVRQALVRVELGGTVQTVGLALDGTATAAPDPGPLSHPGQDGDGGDSGAPEPDPAPETTPRSRAAAPGPRSVVPLRRLHRVAGRRVAPVAVLRCPAGSSPCVVRTPRRVRVRIAGRYHGAWVLAPRRLRPGGRAVLRVRLARRAHIRLAGHHALVRVRVRIVSRDGRAFRLARARVGRGW